MTKVQLEQSGLWYPGYFQQHNFYKGMGKLRVPCRLSQHSACSSSSNHFKLVQMGIPAPRSVHTKHQFTLALFLMEGSHVCTAEVHISVTLSGHLTWILQTHKSKTVPLRWQQDASVLTFSGSRGTSSDPTPPTLLHVGSLVTNLGEESSLWTSAAVFVSSARD